MFQTRQTTETPLWITPEERCPRGPVALYTTFRAEDACAGAMLEITGLGMFRAYLNGVRVGEDYLTPGCNDYDAYVRVFTYPVGTLLRAGEDNLLTVWLGDGWYRGRYGIDKAEASGGCVWGDRYLLSAQLYLPDGSDSARVPVVTTTDVTRWRARTTPLISTSVYDGEVWDFTRPCRDGYACVPAGGTLPETRVYAPGAPVRLHGIREAVRLRTPAGETVLDFGENLAGILRVTGALPHGKTLVMEHGELLQDGCFCRDNLRTARAALTVTGDGAERVLEPLFTYFGFRYVRLSGLSPQENDRLRFQALILSSAGECTLSFSCDRPEPGALIAAARRGQLANFMDIPTDCPQRDERLGWGADAWIFAGTACYLSDCRAFYEKYLNDLRIEQVRYYAGDLPMYTPSLKGEAGAGGAGWADVGVLLPWTLYERYGSREALARHYPLMKTYTDCLLAREAGRGLIRGAFTFGDWLAGDGMTPQSRDGGTEHDYITNLFLWRDLSVCASAAAALGNSADVCRYETAADRVRRAFLDEYFTPGGRLCVDTQTAHVLSLAFRLYRTREAVSDGLARRLARDLWVMKTGFLGTPFLLPVLFDCGMDDAAYRILFRRTPPGWLYELDMGATTFWERWNSLLPDGHLSGTGMNSLNHYAYGSVCEALVSRIAGLMPESPGWDMARIQPHPGAALHRLDMAFESPRGRFEIGWRVGRDAAFTVSGCVPEGVRARVILPDGTAYQDISGDFRFRCAPLPALVHPFGPDTPLADIVENPEAAALMRRLLPRAYAIVTGDEPDLLALTPRVLTSLAFLGISESQLTAFGDGLKRISTFREEEKA